ncbi:DUF2000 domain-containing protein [Brevibacillus migulae]|uniref:DUF2000 domain-containing protein n=1 Tax=Brevibacillus migulae TaxID=1644114 RepID=UPI00106F0166|nr:DUF2000 domain-containing protein [Brevibacillus migulae]
MSEKKREGIKCVMVIDGELPVGLIANTAAILGVTLGTKQDGIIGEDLQDGSGQRHLGITTIPIPILKASKEEIRSLREAAAKEEPDVMIVDFSAQAQSSRAYEEYATKLRQSEAMGIDYLGIALYGEDKIVKKLTGQIALLK